MLRNYFVTALRHFWRHKVFSFINLVGLSLGLAGSLLIFLWVQDELRYDQFHANNDRLFLLLANWSYSDGSSDIDVHTPPNLSAYLRDAAPEITRTTRLVTGWLPDVYLSRGETKIKQSGIYVDSTFLGMFTYPLREGDPAQALVNPQSIVISQTAARVLFPSEEALGQIVTLNEVEGRRDYQVTGILADTPGSSSLAFDFVLPYPDLENRNDWLTKWGSVSVITLIELQHPGAVASVNEKIASLITKHKEDMKVQIQLFPYADLHLRAPFRADDKFYQGDLAYVYLFSAVALLILVIACINFVNLTTARATQRATEVGIRKAAGAARRALAAQFMYESWLTVGMATTLALLLVALFLPLFNQLVAKELVVPYEEPWFLGLTLSIVVLAVLLSGSYPAWVLSSFKPVTVLKSRSVAARRNGPLRQVLVVVQFVFSTILIVGAFAIYSQIQYIHEKNLGLDRDNVLSFSTDPTLNQHFDVFRQELLRHPAFQAVTRSAESPISTGSASSDPHWPGKAEGDNRDFNLAMVDYDFFRTLGIRITAGRSFSPQHAQDTVNYLLNEEAVRAMGLEHPVGTELGFWRGSGQVIGVVEDFHYRSMHQKIGPMVFILWPENTEQAYVRITPGRTAKAVAALSDIYAHYQPDLPIDYQFLDDNFDRLYRSERRIGSITNAFTALALIISALGLLGMATFTAQRRRKEVGVRKVLGASVPHLLLLLSRDYFKLMLVATLIAIPIANFVLAEWLTHFAYHITLRWWLFALPSLLILVVAMLSVSSQTLRAATRNPVDSLRDE